MSNFKVLFYKAETEVSNGKTNKEKSAEASYTLEHGNIIEEEKDKEGNYIYKDERKVTYLLKDVSFHKEVYRPGEVEFVVQITLTSTKNKIVWEKFENKKGITSCPIIDLLLDGSTIALTYWVFQTTFRKGHSSENQTVDNVTEYNTIYYATFKAYSIDKFLTIDKFNSAFTGRKLLGDVYYLNNLDNKQNDNKQNDKEQNDKEQNDNDQSKAGIVHAVLDNVKTTAFDRYKDYIYIDETTTNGIVPNLNYLIKEELEAVLPYNVQYNESFYDFLVRICNRNGEFLYCKKNKLFVGLEIASKSTELGGYSGVEYDETYLNLMDEAAWMDRNPLVDEYAIPTGAAVMTDTVYPPDYLATIQKKDYSAWEDYVAWPSTVFTALKSAAECQAVADIIATAAIEIGMPNAYAAVRKYLIDKGYENEYFPDDIDDYQPFTNANINVDTEFYKNILEGEKRSEQGRVVVTYDVCQIFDLGDKVKLDGSEYIVYRVKGSYKPDGENGLIQTYELLLVPVQKKTSSSNSDGNGETSSNSGGNGEASSNSEGNGETSSNSGGNGEASSNSEGNGGTSSNSGGNGEASSNSEGNGETSSNSDGNGEASSTSGQEEVYPLPLTDLRVRKSSPQRAIVVSNYDPEKLGRVRVRYFWQKKDDDATPWIRVSAPGASKGAGLMFYHQKDDEVLIDYDEGNIEHPFVAGALYNRKNELPGSSEPHLHGESHSLSSANGHHLSFTDTKSAKFGAELVPIWSTLSKFGFGADFSLEKTEGMGGGFEIADKHGFYSITGSTHGRNISINSPLGDIVLDAFTGISIKAPLGNIELVGKNVRIEARNNLELISGSNIKNPYFFEGGWSNAPATWKNIGKVQVKALASSIGNGMLDFLGVDLALYRTLLEVFLRPIGGTMLIKSNRFMRLEAGEGKASIFRTRKQSKASTVGHFFTKTPIESESLHELINKVKNACQEYNRLYEMVTDENGALIASVREYHNETDDTSNYKKKKEEIDFVKVMFDEEKKESDVDAFANNQSLKLEAKEKLKTLLQRINELKKKINVFVKYKDLEKWNDYNQKIKDLGDNMKNSIAEYLRSTDKDPRIDFVQSSGLLAKLIDRSYREILVDNVKKHCGSFKCYSDISINATVIGNTIPGNAQSGWDQFDKAILNNAIKNNTKETKTGKVLQWLKEFSKFDGFVDDNAWGADDKGDIIFSSKKDASYRIKDDGGIDKINNDIREELIAKLIDAKTLY